MKKVSVIIPAYNRAATLKRSIDSVLAQTYPELELIIVDDCSADNTKELVESIADDRLIYLRHEINQGACAARNTGIAAASGEYIAFQDSDDFWHPEKLKIQIDKMEQANAEVCFCRLKQYGPDGKYIGRFPKALEEGIIPYKVLYRYSQVSTQTIIGKSEAFREFLFDPKVKKSQDYDWVLRAGEKYKFYFVDEMLVDQYIQNDSISIGGKKKSLEMCAYFLEKYKDKCEQDVQFHAALLNQIAHNKSILGQDASGEYLAIYKMTHSRKTLMQYVAAKTGMLQLYRKAKVTRNKFRRK